MSRRIAHP